MQSVSKNSSLDKLSNLSIKENENLGAWIKRAEKLLWRGLRAEVVSEREIVQKMLLLCDKRMEEGSAFWMRDQFENVHTLRVAKALIRELEGKARLPKLKSASRGKSGKRREEESVLAADQKREGCWQCGSKDHWRGDCPLYKCFYCKKQGHKKPNCPELGKSKKESKEEITKYSLRCLLVWCGIP